MDLTGRRVSAFKVAERVPHEDALTEVWLAKHATVPSQRALRILRPEQEEHSEALLAAWWAQRTLAHPNRIDQYELPMIDGLPAQLTEYVGGPSLATWAKVRPRPVEELLRTFAEVLDAVGFGHRAGIAHGALDAQRIRMRQDGGGFLPKVDYAPGVLATRVPLGRFMAPEQVKGLVTPRTDLYLLGIVLHEMFARRPAVFPLCRLAEVRGDVPPGLDQLVSAMIASDEADRPSTVDDVGYEVGRILRGGSDPVLSTPKPQDERWGGKVMARLQGLTAWLRT